MECRLIDSNVTTPISDMCMYRESLVVSAYDKFLRVYSGHSFVSKCLMPEVVFKMCTDGEYLICGTVSRKLLFLDFKFNIVDSLCLPLDINILQFYQDQLVIGSWAGKLAVLNRKDRTEGGANEPENKDNSRLRCGMGLGIHSYLYELNFVKSSNLKVLAIACGYNCIAVALENVVEVYDRSFSCVHKSTVNGPVNSLSIGDGCLFIGLLSGKVYFVDFKDSDKSYIFYAHIENKPETKIYHSVNQLEINTYLYSAGSNGRLCCWDLERRKLHNLVLNAGCNIRKFILHGQYVYAILEDVPNRLSISNVVFVKTTSR